MLEQIQYGVTTDGQRIVIAGVEKVGKTTLACSAPDALLIQMEMGAGSIPIPKLPMVNTWLEVEALCQELINAYKTGRIKPGSTIVWDSATALERIIHAHTIATDPDVIKNNAKNPNMETVHGGYGKAYQIANQYFERWTRYQDELATYGKINIIVTCHVFASRVVDPAYGEYDSWDLLLHSPKNLKSYGKREFITQWADMIGFLHEPLFILKQEKGQQLVKGIDANQGRLLAVDRTPGWVAGNRYGLSGTIPMPPPENDGSLTIKAWNNLAWSIYNSRGLDLFNRK